MRPAPGLAVLLAAVSGVAALPVPQYGPPGMGGYGYPMGGGGGPMMGGGGGGGPMMGPYGMGNQGGPMYMPGGGSNRYMGGRMRGQRYHAHAGVDEWPMPANPYMDARSRRRFGKSAFYANGDGAMGDPMMRAPGHNRIPTNDDDDDGDDDGDHKDSKGPANDASDGSTRVAGVNRASASPADDAKRLASLSSEQAAAADSNTSLDLASLSSKIINIGAFDGASIKSTSTASAARKTGAVPAHKETTSAQVRHTVTRPLGSHVPSPTPKAPAHAPASVARAAGVARAAAAPGPAPASKVRAHSAPATSSAGKTHLGAGAPAHTPAAPAKHEQLSMKNIRGM
ncbi:hypothetical protein H4R19_000115 [Coemansia spiralis]|nr:hypothetical protein H4R19_000115 [Coemansia spiralis]